MEFKDESTGLQTAVTTSSDVTDAGALGASQPGSATSSVTSPVVGSVVDQPQSTASHATSPPVEGPASQLEGSFSVLAPPVGQPCSEPSRPCPAPPELAPHPPVSEHVPQTGDAITVGAPQVSTGEEPAEHQEQPPPSGPPVQAPCTEPPCPPAELPPHPPVSGHVPQTGDAVTVGAPQVSTGEEPPPAGPPVPASCTEPPCAPAELASYPPDTGEAIITAGAQQVSRGEQQSAAAADESVSTLSHNVEQNLVISQPSVDLQPLQQPPESVTLPDQPALPVVEAADLQQSLHAAAVATTQQAPQQPATDEQQLPGVASAPVSTELPAEMVPTTPLATENAHMLTETMPSTAAQQQQNVDQIFTAGLRQQAPEAATLPRDQPLVLPAAAESVQPPPQTAAEQPVSLSAPALAEGDAAVTECQPPPAIDAEQQPPSTVADTAAQQPVSVTPNSHRPPDTTRRSCLCRVWRGGVNWTIANNVFRLYFFCSPTVLSCRESSSYRRGRHDADRTVLSGLAWRCELGIRGRCVANFNINILIYFL